MAIGLQPNSAMAVLQGLASQGRKFQRIVLMHGPNQSRLSADAVAQFGASLKIVVPKNPSNSSTLEKFELDQPFDSGVVSRLHNTMFSEGGVVDTSALNDWIVVYGSGTVPMNVALVGPWLKRDEYWSHLWDYNEVTRRLTNANGYCIEFGHASRIPLETLVAARTRREPSFVSRPDSASSRTKIGREVFASAISHLAGSMGARLAQEIGPTLEREVERFLRQSLPNTKSLQRNLELRFQVGQLPASSREIDVLLESPSGRLLLVSCAAVTSKNKSTTAIRTEVRHKVNEVRQLATNYFGSEAKTLTVFLTWSPAGTPLPESPIIAGARFDAQITNHPTAKHWLISGHELFGTTKREYRATINDPQRADKRIPGLSSWLKA